MSTFDEMVSFLDTTWNAKGDIVPCLIGAPGIGKTDAVYQHAENVGANNVVTIIASQILPNEVSGITMPDERTRSMEIYDHYRLSSLKDGDILFFDELLEADQSTLSACLTLIESRMMMSGKLLPDIQIIAATNPTIQPIMLKANIRQRFLFKKFELDGKGTKQYILDTLGLAIPDTVISLLTDHNDQHYNILTPRTLTKLCRWALSVSDNDLPSVSSMIDDMFTHAIGSEIAGAVWKKRNKPDYLAKHRIAEVLRKHEYMTINNTPLYNDAAEFMDISMEELMNALIELPDWKEISEELSKINLEGDEIKTEDEIKY